jgi:hypothetical protein
MVDTTRRVCLASGDEGIGYRDLSLLVRINC